MVPFTYREVGVEAGTVLPEQNVDEGVPPGFTEPNFTMGRIWYRTGEDEEWQPFRCPVSGTLEFDHHRGDGYAKWIIHNRHGTEARYGDSPEEWRFRWYADPGFNCMRRDPEG